MLVGKFREHASEYKNFEIWDVSGFEDFLNGNATIREIASKEFKITGAEKDNRTNKPVVKSIGLIRDILDLVNDKYFLVFEKNDEIHSELKAMQSMRSMNFGVDIGNIDETHVYIMIMDKTANKTFF